MRRPPNPVAFARLALIALWFVVPACPAAIGGDFTLTADDGSRYALQDSRGRVVVLDFGYTFCPDVCPTALNTIAIALNRLDDTQRARVDALFVTLDPERDTPEKLREYTAFFHPKLRGLTGSAQALHEVAERYRVRYAFVGKDGNNRHYSLDHSANIYILDGDGRVFRILPHGLPPEMLADSIRAALSLSPPRAPVAPTTENHP